MAHEEATLAMILTISGAKETKTTLVEFTEKAPTEMAKMMTEAVRREAAGPTHPKPVTVQHAPKLPKGMGPSACHTIGGTGAEKRVREDDGKNAILRVPKHLVVHVHVDEHPVGTGEDRKSVV